MQPQNIQLKFRIENKDIFDAIRNGFKKIETRAATQKYKNVKVGDTLEFVCDEERFSQEVAQVKYFATVQDLVKVYKPQDINPKTNTTEQLIAMYYTFPDYRDKIEEFGIVAFELI